MGSACRVSVLCAAVMQPSAWRRPTRAQGPYYASHAVLPVKPMRRMSLWAAPILRQLHSEHTSSGELHVPTARDIIPQPQPQPSTSHNIEDSATYPCHLWCRCGKWEGGWLNVDLVVVLQALLCRLCAHMLCHCSPVARTCGQDRQAAAGHRTWATTCAKCARYVLRTTVHSLYSTGLR